MFDPQEDTGATQASLALTGRIWLSILKIFNLRFITTQGNVKKNTEIGTIHGSWAPLFRISFNLIIHSYVKGKGKQGWSSVLAFEKKPSLDLNRNGDVRIFFQQRKYTFILNVVLNKWYTIGIEQKINNKKVRKVHITR